MFTEHRLIFEGPEGLSAVDATPHAPTKPAMDPAESERIATQNREKKAQRDAAEAKVNAANGNPDAIIDGAETESPHNEQNNKQLTNLLDNVTVTPLYQNEIDALIPTADPVTNTVDAINITSSVQKIIDANSTLQGKEEQVRKQFTKDLAAALNPPSIIEQGMSTIKNSVNTLKQTVSLWRKSPGKAIEMAMKVFGEISTTILGMLGNACDMIARSAGPFGKTLLKSFPGPVMAMERFDIQNGFKKLQNIGVQFIDTQGKQLSELKSETMLHAYGTLKDVSASHFMNTVIQKVKNKFTPSTTVPVQITEQQLQEVANNVASEITPDVTPEPTEAPPPEDGDTDGDETEAEKHAREIKEAEEELEAKKKKAADAKAKADDEK